MLLHILHSIDVAGVFRKEVEYIESRGGAAETLALHSSIRVGGERWREAWQMGRVKDIE